MVRLKGQDSTREALLENLMRAWRQTHYDLLGVPVGASIEHVKDSYRLLTKKTAVTDVAYEVLTDKERRRKYDAWLMGTTTQVAQAEQDWGKRGRERCSCGKILDVDDEWLCRECWGKLDYLVVFDMFGGHVVPDTDVLVPSETEGNGGPSPVTCFGPFTKEEAEAFLKERNEERSRF